jgi:hypothetical protein
MRSSSYFRAALATSSLWVLLGSAAAAAQDTTQVPAEIAVDDYNNEGPAALLGVADSIVRIYRDSIPWFGENRDVATLESLGKVIGTDLFIHPLSDLSAGIPRNTHLVLISSNGGGLPPAAASQNDPAAQAALNTFVQSGGVLIVDMGDNLEPGGFIAPGAKGTPDLVFPTPQEDATLSAAAKGPDGVIATPDDHPIVKGPDGVAGTDDDLNDSNIDACCSVAHGNLEQGITLPGSTSVLMMAAFDGNPRGILAEYELGGGLVILDTVTKESFFHSPRESGPSIFMRALFAYAMAADRGVPVYACVGFEAPMNDGAIRVQKNRALPHKALIVDADGFQITPAEIAASPVIQVVFSGNAVPAEDVTDDALFAGQGTPGNQFVFTDEEKWQFNLKTGNYTTKGSYRVTMVSGDPSAYVIDPTCEALFVK